MKSFVFLVSLLFSSLALANLNHEEIKGNYVYTIDAQPGIKNHLSLGNGGDAVLIVEDPTGLNSAQYEGTYSYNESSGLLSVSYKFGDPRLDLDFVDSISLNQYSVSDLHSGIKAETTSTLFADYGTFIIHLSKID